MATAAEREFVEKVGRHFEQLGFPRMGGRVFGWLLISEEPRASMAELMDALQASKSSISSMTRLLMQVGLIEVVSRPGVRRDYFAIRADAWTNSLRDRFTQATTFRQLAEEGLALLKGSPAGRQQRLREMRLMYAFLAREIPVLQQRWEKERQALYKAAKSS